jgi:hypothetical protein
LLCLASEQYVPDNDVSHTAALSLGHTNRPHIT